MQRAENLRLSGVPWPHGAGPRATGTAVPAAEGRIAGCGCRETREPGFIVRALVSLHPHPAITPASPAQAPGSPLRVLQRRGVEVSHFTICEICAI
jgi:hypothetical protein